VHGDFGRTRPSVGELLGCRADIMQLDVTEIDMEFGGGDGGGSGGGGGGGVSNSDDGQGGTVRVGGGEGEAAQREGKAAKLA